MNTLKRIILSVALTLGLASPALLPAVAHAQPAGSDGKTINDAGLCGGANLTFAEGDCASTDTAATQVDGIITTVINIISIVVGIVAVIMIIIGGFKYITSNGDSGAVSGAKNTILYAIVGLVVVALAQIIVRFVVNRLTTDAPVGG